MARLVVTCGIEFRPAARLEYACVKISLVQKEGQHRHFALEGQPSDAHCVAEAVARVDTGGVQGIVVEVRTKTWNPRRRCRLASKFGKKSD